MFTYADVVSIEPLSARIKIPYRLSDPAVAPDDALISTMWAEGIKAVAHATVMAEGQARGLLKIARVLGMNSPYTVPIWLRNEKEKIKREPAGIFGA